MLTPNEFKGCGREAVETVEEKHSTAEFEEVLRKVAHIFQDEKVIQYCAQCALRLHREPILEFSKQVAPITMLVLLGYELRLAEERKENQSSSTIH